VNLDNQLNLGRLQEKAVQSMDDHIEKKIQLSPEGPDPPVHARLYSCKYPHRNQDVEILWDSKDG